MPRIQIGAKQAARPNDWRQAVLDQLRSGKVLPIISNRFHDDLLLGGHDQLVRDYAEHYRIPHESGGDLPAAAQYKTVMREVAGAGDFIRREYLEFVKSRLMDLAEAEAKKSNDNNLAGLLEDEESQFDEHDFSTLAANLGYPRFDVPEKDPLLILAGFDLPVYLTTSFLGCWNRPCAGPENNRAPWSAAGIRELQQMMERTTIHWLPTTVLLFRNPWFAISTVWTAARNRWCSARTTIFLFWSMSPVTAT